MNGLPTNSYYEVTSKYWNLMYKNSSVPINISSDV
jgi:hypothetical protein